MGTWEQIAILAALVAATGCLLYRCRQLERQRDEAEEQAREWGALLALEHETALRLAYELHGRAAVDRAIKDAHEKGKN